MDIKKILFKTNTIDVEKALPDAVVYCNKDGKIQWVNDKAAEIFETSKMHLLTSNIADFIENALNLASTAIITEKPVIVKFVEREVYFEMTSKELDEGFVLDFREAGQASLGIVETSEEEYKEINREKNNFLLKLSNEFKSPLQSIVGFSQAMADGLGGTMSIQQEKYINIIKKNSSDLMYFINKLLELSFTEVDAKIPEARKFDISNLIGTVAKFNEQLHKGKDIRWSITQEDGFNRLLISDEEIIKTVLQNVLEVILKSIDMGEVCINLSTPNEEFIKSKGLPQREYIQISLSSSALLLSELDLESMFDPYKIIDTTNRKNLLRAITLACVKNYIQLLHGAIWVESQILKSTSFNIILPREEN